MADESEYERQRLANIEDNRQKLIALGLEKPLIEKAKPPPRVHVASEPGVRSRSSTRVSKRPQTFEQLTDSYFRQEERQAERGERRPRKQSMFFDPTDFRPEPRAPRSISGSNSVATNSIANSFVVPTGSLPPPASTLQPTSAPVAVASNDVKPYYASGKLGLCPICLDWFTIRKKDGRLHFHHCHPVASASLPSVAPVAPVLPPM